MNICGFYGVWETSARGAWLPPVALGVGCLRTALLYKERCLACVWWACIMCLQDCLGPCRDLNFILLGHPSLEDASCLEWQRNCLSAHRRPGPHFSRERQHTYHHLPGEGGEEVLALGMQGQPSKLKLTAALLLQRTFT